MVLIVHNCKRLKDISTGGWRNAEDQEEEDGCLEVATNLRDLTCQFASTFELRVNIMKKDIEAKWGNEKGEDGGEKWER